MDRRHWLQGLATGALAACSGRLIAAPTTSGTKLLLVFLRGGYDCANLLVPLTSSFYHESRPTIAIGQPGTPGGALPLDADWGLHPSLADSLQPLYQKRQLAFIPFAGASDLTRSHFETQDAIELGQPMGERRDFRSGFLNRLAAELGTSASGAPRARPMAFTDQLPIVLRGEVSVPNLTLTSVSKPAVDARQARIIQSMYEGTGLASAVTAGFDARAEVMRSMQAEMEAANRNAISSKGFESIARRMAHLMRARCDIGFIDVGGWDTHVGQGGATGQLANRFGELGRGLAGFANEMAETWSRTVVIVVSEFGRTFRENGNRGTDHGHGTVYWVLGGSIAGGRVAGDQVAVNAANLFQNRDYPVLNDYRALLGGMFARMYGLESSALHRIFPASTPKDLGLV